MNQPNIEIEKQDFTKTNTILIITAVGITGLLSFLLVFKQYRSVWFDEVASINVFTSDWKTMWLIITRDTHPPLYYLIMKIVVSIFGNHYRVIKTAQIIPIFALHLWSAVLIIRNKQSIRKFSSGILMVLFIFATFAPLNFTIRNVEIRMYSWAMFFVTMSGIYAYRLILNLIGTEYSESRWNILFFILFSLAAALTHYYALFCEVIIYLLVFIFILSSHHSAKGKFILILKLFVPTVIGYSWWIPYGIKQVLGSGGNIDWITFSFSDLPALVERFIGFDLRYELLFIGLVIMEAVYSFLTAETVRRSEMKAIFITGIVFWSMPLLLIVLGTILSVLIKPILLERYLFPAMGTFWLGIILLMSLIKSRRQFIYCGILTGALLFLFITNIPAQFRQEYETGTREIVQFINPPARRWSS